METVCIKIATLIDADALKIYLESYDIPVVVAPYPEAMINTLGSESLTKAVLVRQEDLTRVVEALQAEENDLLTPDEMAALTGSDDAPEDDVIELLDAYKEDVKEFVDSLSGDDDDDDDDDEEEDADDDEDAANENEGEAES